ncbi:MAG: acyl-CoA reductase [Clostridiales bacterium]|nr:acyl-CoA reductase [Clostridiales bacterium]
MITEPLSQTIEKISWLLGTAQQCTSIRQQPPLSPFEEDTIEFLDRISRTLRCHPEARKMSDLMSFAFWCRRAHLELLRREYTSPENSCIGRRVSLHFASSNMPMLFAFSLVSGLLAGNSCIVRLPRKGTRQEQIVMEVMGKIIRESCPIFDGRIILCRYDHDMDVNQVLTDLCDVRVLWGTDASIAAIRKVQLKPEATDICFGTRFSAAILSAKTVLDTSEADLLAKDFYNDTYLNDQNACSSPRILYWVGTHDEVQLAKERFWTAVQRLLDERQYIVPASVAVQKLDAALMLAASYSDVAIIRGGTMDHRLSGEVGIQAGYEENNSPIRKKDNRILRVEVRTLHPGMWERTVPGGFFLEAEGETPGGLFPVLDRRCQTLTCYGLDQEKLKERLHEAKVAGVDRLVDFGHALDFSLTWDRHNLIGEMSVPV